MSWLEDTFKIPNPIDLLIKQTVVRFDGNVWNFYIDAKKIIIHDVSSPEELRKKYFRAFKVPCASFTDASWERFLIDVQVVIESLDNETIEKVEKVLEAVYDRSVSDDPMDSLTKLKGKPIAFFDDGRYICLPLLRLREIIRDTCVNIDLPLLSHILTDWGYKTQGVVMVQYGECCKESFEFIKTREFVKCLPMTLEEYDS
jgi:hypothetical protein